MSHWRGPMVPREVTAAPWPWATYATAIASLWTSIPMQRVRDWDMVDLRVYRGGDDTRRLWLRVSSPASHQTGPCLTSLSLEGAAHDDRDRGPMPALSQRSARQPWPNRSGHSARALPESGVCER